MSGPFVPLTQLSDESKVVVNLAAVVLFSAAFGPSSGPDGPDVIGTQLTLIDEQGRTYLAVREDRSAILASDHGRYFLELSIDPIPIWINRLMITHIAAARGFSLGPGTSDVHLGPGGVVRVLESSDQILRQVAERSR